MATWIVHLRLAENLLVSIKGLDAQLFAIGNIAPDSGIPDERWEQFDPPSEVTHFRTSDDPMRCVDLDFYRRYLAPPSQFGDDPRRFSFLLGYFLHLVTDNLWYDEIGIPAKARFATEFAADPRFIWEVKRDWYGLDLLYVRSHPQSLFWQVFLDSAYSQDYLDFLPPEAIRRSIDYIKTFYQRTDAEMEQRYGERPDCYLSKAEMDSFVDRTTRRLDEIHRCLWEEGIDPLDLLSALDLNEREKP